MFERIVPRFRLWSFGYDLLSTPVQRATGVVKLHPDALLCTRLKSFQFMACYYFDVQGTLSLLVVMICGAP